MEPSYLEATAIVRISAVRQPSQTIGAGRRANFYVATAKSHGKVVQQVLEDHRHPEDHLVSFPRQAGPLTSNLAVASGAASKPVWGGWYVVSGCLS